MKAGYGTLKLVTRSCDHNRLITLVDAAQAYTSFVTSLTKQQGM